MPFDPEKDKILKQWRCEETGLIVAIHQYADGEPKVQIGPRVFVRKDGKESQRRAGRLAMEDIAWLYDTIDEIKETLEDMVTPG